VGHSFRWNLHGLTGFWVAPSTGRPVVEPEASETAYFNAVPLRQRVAQRFKNGLDRKLGIFGRELREEGSESIDELGTDHWRILRGTSAREWWQTTQRQAQQHR
jgi:sugar-specific transcriptional regulator TrmB